MAYEARNSFDTLLEDTDTKDIPVQPKPGYLQSYLDQVFKVKITRITGDEGVAVPNIGGAVWGNMNRHFYSKRQCWNADETLFWVRYNDNGTGFQFFLDGETYQPLYSRTFPLDDETIWHPTDPNTMFYCDGPSIRTMNVPANTTQLVKTFSGYSVVSFGRWEGNFTNDANKVVMWATRTGDGGIDIFVYTIDTDTKGPVLDIGTSYTEDWAGITPLGTYVIVEGNWPDVRVYNTSMSLLYDLAPTAGMFHFDVGVDHLGNEILLGPSVGYPPDEGINRMYRINNQQLTFMHTGNGVSHTGMRNINKPGWAFSSVVDATEAPYQDEIIVVGTAGVIKRVAHHHSSQGDYFAEVHPSASPSGTRVAFASDWEAPGNRPVQLYVAELRPSLCIPR